MGGQNHQPTNHPLTAPSAWLSQRIGQGFALVLEANNHLEDAIVLGMNKVYVEDLASSLSGTPSDYLSSTIALLERSRDVLGQIQIGFKRLFDAAATEGYKGNPLASQVEAFDLLPKFEAVLIRPFAHTRVWQELEQRVKSHNVLATLEWEATQFELLAQPTRDLINVLRECLRIANHEGGRAFVDSVENNEIPLRQYYAQVFSLWNTLHAMFLYSALLMTELFYKVNGYPSLLDFDPASTNVHAA